MTQTSCWWLLARWLWLLALAPLPCLAQTAPAAPSVLVIAVDEEPHTYGNRLVQLIYADIGRRLGLKIEVKTFPQQRRSVMANEGLIDGETARVHAYGANFPNLVRVEEAVLDLSFALYTAQANLHLSNLQDLTQHPRLLAEHRRGVLFCERQLKAVLPPERISDVNETVQGAKKLQAGRTDVYCDLEIAFNEVLDDPEFKSGPSLRKLLTLGLLPTYPYLHKKHSDLAPRMATVIRQMKAEGRIEAYKNQARHETRRSSPGP